MKLIRSNSSCTDFVALLKELDQELNERYGRAQKVYDQHNIVENLDTVVVGYHDDLPVACGCFKLFDDSTVEIKRVFVRHKYRRKGLSTRLLISLENWAAALGFKRAVLETGKGQPEAIGLYRKNGYDVIENFGPYRDMENSVCMEKSIIS